MSDTPAWLLVALPVLGYAAAVATEVLRSRLESDRAASTREAERMLRLADRRDTFELETLQQLVDALNDLGRAAVRYHLKDTAIAKTTPGGRYAAHRIADPELDETFRLSQMRTNTLIDITLDDECRAAAQLAKESLGRPSLMMGSDPRDADAAMTAAITELDACLNTIGARIRLLYGPPRL